MGTEINPNFSQKMGTTISFSLNIIIKTKKKKKQILISVIQKVQFENF